MIPPKPKFAPTHEALRAFIHNAALDPGIVDFERIVYKAVLVEHGSNIEHVVSAATQDALIMLRGVAQATYADNNTDPGAPRLI